MKQNGKTRVLAWIIALGMLSGCTVLGESPKSSSQEGHTDASGAYRPVFPDRAEKLKKAAEKNSDVVGWLTLPNTAIDEAVVQTGDNEYYLRRNAEKKYSYEGCYYMDYESVMFNEGRSLAMNTIIYGHNLGRPMGTRDDPNGAKFAQLLKLNDEETAEKTPYVFLKTKGAEHIFQIFAAFYSEAFTKPVSYHHAQYSKKELETLAADARARSVYLYDVKVTGDDKILTLSTCTYRYGTYSQNPDQRFVVMARLVREGEAFEERARITKNPAPREPDFVRGG